MIYGSDEFGKNINGLEDEKLTQENNMDNTLQLLQSVDSENLVLEISEQDLEQAQLIAQNYANETGRYHAFINYLCLSLLLKRLKKDLDWKIYPKTTHNIWQFINGSAISIDSQQIVIIPSDATDIQGFEIEQEWVDLPELAADYYIPVQVNLEEKYLYFWGFISRRNLQEKAEYDAVYRMYFVDADWVIDSLELLWIAHTFPESEKTVTFPSPILEEQSAENLIQTLSQPSPYSPRLNVSFEQWGALLNEDHWLQKLYVECLIKSDDRPLVIRLNKTLSLDSILEEKAQDLTRSSAKSYALRSRGHRYKLEMPQTIKEDIQTLTQEAEQKNLLSDVKDEIKDEELLLYFLLKTPKSLSGKAAEIVWEIASSEPATDQKRVINIERQLSGYSIALKIAIVSISTQKTILLLRIYSTGEQLYVPPGLQLTVLNQTGEAISKLDVTARTEPLDDYIQLYFAADRGETFGCRVILEHNSFTEYFMV